MEDVILPPSQKHTVQTRKSGPQNKDLWLVVREGSVSDLELALSLLKKHGGNINARNTFGVTPLHIAAWRNHVPVVRRLLEAGADPNARDGESGWSSLHRALHFGHLAVACVLIQFGASLTLEDSKSRTPVDLLSGPVLQTIGKDNSSISTEVFSWGSGVNYQLGTGNAHIQKLPCKVDSLHGSFIKMISAAKFHSVAVSARGEVYTWGFGRGGRLGHPEFDIHSGQAAVITPRQVCSGLGARRVRVIAAAKHHTVVATEGGEVFTWGSNREGQLGYTSVDTQPTPRRVSALKSRIIAVSAANKHTAVVSEGGEIFTWGCNKEGQLGYGTSNSGSNYTPRVVEYLKGRSFVGVSAAKYHTIVLGSDGEVFTWGHRLVTPRRVVVARNTKKAGNTLLKFHRKERLNVIGIAAGMTHSLALTDDGALLFWASADLELRCHQLYTLCGRSMVSISAGKYWTAAVTATGNIYMWDGKNGKPVPPIPTRLNGVKKATSVSVGETHLLFISSVYHPDYLPSTTNGCEKTVITDELDVLGEGFMFDDVESEDTLLNTPKDDMPSSEVSVSRNFFDKSAPSLKSLCEKTAAEHLVEPRNAIQLLEIADTLGADDLKRHCVEIAFRNLDYILTVGPHAFAETSLDILAKLENLLDQKSSEPWSHRRLPTPTATFPAIINSEEDDSESDLLRNRDDARKRPTHWKDGDNQRLEGFLLPNDAVIEGIDKQIRALRKKLQQIELLEEKRSKGQTLDDQQIAKLQTRSVLESSLAELGAPIETVQSRASPADGRVSKRVGNKKQRRKSKQKVKEGESSDMAIHTEMGIVKGFPNAEVAEDTSNKGKAAHLEGPMAVQATEVSPFYSKKATEDDTPQNKKSAPNSASKKKNRKGGLSMFLSGALDLKPEIATPPPVTAKSEGPAWGGAKISRGSASLRDIQVEQSKTETKLLRKKDPEDSSVGGTVGGKLLLSSLLPSAPIAMALAGKGQVSDGDKNTPPWAASSTPPSLSRPSIRDIQLQQGKQHQGISHSPKSRTTGFSVTTGQGSPSESAGVNRWFKPEADATSSIRSIQIEEKAIKDLKRFYSSVRIVKNQS